MTRDGWVTFLLLTIFAQTANRTISECVVCTNVSVQTKDHSLLHPKCLSVRSYTSPRPSPLETSDWTTEGDSLGLCEFVVQRLQLDQPTKGSRRLQHPRIMLQI